MTIIERKVLMQVKIEYQHELTQFHLDSVTQDRCKESRDAILNICAGYDLQDCLSLFSESFLIGDEVSEGDKETVLRRALATLLQLHWLKTENTALSYCVNPRSSANQLLFELFSLVYGRWPDARDLLLFSPNLKCILDIREGVVLSVSVDEREEFNRLRCGALKDWVVVSGKAFNAAAFARLCRDQDLSVEAVGQVMEGLLQRDPLFLEALRAYSHYFSIFISLWECQRGCYFVRDKNSGLNIPPYYFRRILDRMDFQSNNLGEIGGFLYFFDSEEDYTICLEEVSIKRALSACDMLIQVLTFLETPLKTKNLLAVLLKESFFPIRTFANVISLLSSLAPTQVEAVYPLLKEKLVGFIRDDKALSRAIKHLSVAQAEDLRGVLKGHASLKRSFFLPAPSSSAAEAESTFTAAAESTCAATASINNH